MKEEDVAYLSMYGKHAMKESCSDICLLYCVYYLYLLIERSMPRV